jgi:hypothetical protein
MDGDSFFINMDIKLEKFTEKVADLIATGDENDIINTGHILLKNSEWSKKFVDNWIAFRQPLSSDVLNKFSLITTHFTHHDGQTYFNDQPPVNLILGGADPNQIDRWFDVFNNVNFYEGNKLRKHGIEFSPILDDNLMRTNSLISRELSKHVCIVTQDQMNSYPSTFKKGDFILHWAEQHKELINTHIPMLIENEKVGLFDDNLYELEDNKQIQNIVQKLHDPNDYSTNLEGNCMYLHFTFNKDMDKIDVRRNLYNCAKKSASVLEIGFNAGHSCMLFCNANHSIKALCFDMCYHKYTKCCVDYLGLKYNVQMVVGDSRNTTFGLTGQSYDLIHVDGGHSKELAFKDIINCRNVAHEKTILIIDDANYQQITDIIDFLISCNVLKEVNYESIDCVPNIFHRIFNYIK